MNKKLLYLFFIFIGINSHICYSTIAVKNETNKTIAVYAWTESDKGMQVQEVQSSGYTNRFIRVNYEDILAGKTINITVPSDSIGLVFKVYPPKESTDDIKYLDYTHLSLIDGETYILRKEAGAYKLYTEKNNNKGD